MLLDLGPEIDPNLTEIDLSEPKRITGCKGGDKKLDVGLCSESKQVSAKANGTGGFHGNIVANAGTSRSVTSVSILRKFCEAGRTMTDLPHCN